MKKICVVTENPAYEKIMEESFPNRYGYYLENLMQKAGFAREAYEVVWVQDFAGLLSDAATIITLGRTPTGLLLKLPKSFKMADYVGQRKGQIIPWYSLEHLFMRGKKLEQETIELLGKIK